MFDEDDSEMSDIDPEEIARLVQDVDDLDADMFGLKVTKRKGKAIKSSDPALKTSIPTAKTTEALSGKSRLLAEMFPARSDWLGLHEEPKETSVSNPTPISPRAPRRSRDTAPVATSTAIQTPTERPKFTPTPRRPRPGPADPLGLFQESEGGHSVPGRTDPDLPSWLGGVQTPTHLQEAPLPSPPHTNRAHEQHSSPLQPQKPISSSIEQPRQPGNLFEQQTASKSSTDPQKQLNYTLNQPQHITNKTTSCMEPSKDTSYILEKNEPSNNFQSVPKQFSNIITENVLQKPSQQAINHDQPQLFTNFKFEPKNFQKFEDLPLRTKNTQDQALQPNSSSDLHRLSTDLPRQSTTQVNISSQSKLPQENHKTMPSIQQERFQKPISDTQTSDLPTRQNDSRSPSPRQLNQDNRFDRGYREDQNLISANRNHHVDYDEYQRNRDHDRRLERDLRLDLESRQDRDSRLERLLETLVSRSAVDAQLDGQRMRRELDMLAASLRDEMAAMAGSRRREVLTQEAALIEQSDVARGMDTLGLQLKGLTKALAEHQKCWQRDTAELQAALTQRSEPPPAQQVPVTQHTMSNGNFDFQDKSRNHQQDALSLHASQAYFAQDVKQEIRSAFKDMQQEVSMAGKVSKQAQQDFVEKAERERALFADEINKGRELLVREIKSREQTMAERINLEIASFTEDKRRQRSEFAKEMEGARQENFEAMRKELGAFTEMLRNERTNFNEQLKQERSTFLAKLQEERDMLTTHTSTEVARFTEQLKLSSSALAAELRRERDGLATREAALAERESEVRWRNESLASAARDLQCMAAAAVDARDQGNAALSAAERIEGRECARAAELSTQLSQLRDIERARVARRLAQARQHAGIDGDRSSGMATKISLMQLQAQHDFTMVEADTQLFESLCSVSK